jgi:glycosyltransferase involved in cell wall biosynthesis
MKLLFFGGGSQRWGMEVAMERLMLQLNARGHQTFALISGWNDGVYPAQLSSSGLLFDEIKLGRVYLNNPAWTLHGIRHFPSAVAKLRRLVRQWGPDLVIYFDAQMLLISSLVLQKMPRVLYLHNAPSRLPRYSTFLRSRVNTVICPSRYIAELVNETATRKVKVVIVPTGIELPKRREPKCRHHDLQLGIVGRISPQKQHKVLIDALHLLKMRRPQCKVCLRIIGEGDQEYHAELLGDITRFEMREMVQWVGTKRIRDEIYEDLDVVVAPGLNESFGLTAVEAGAYSLPIVAAKSGGYLYTVLDGTTGFLFTPGDKESLAHSLEKLIVDPQLRERLGRAGRDHVEQHFSEQRMTEEFLEALSGVA